MSLIVAGGGCYDCLWEGSTSTGDRVFDAFVVCAVDVFNVACLGGDV